MITKYFIAILALIILITGCASQQQELEDITLKLKWVHQAQFAGNYIAKEKGFYEEEGLHVAIDPFTFETPTIPAVVEGKAMFGITGADELIIARSKGVPIKAIAVIYKVNPVCAYALAESGITSPSDFVGKTVGIERASDGTDINIGILYMAMMNKLGIDREQINEITIGYDATELLNGETDVSTGYIINEPHMAIEAGHEVNTILMADYGVNMYADVLVATDDTINNHPELVTKFLRATLKGWQYAIENEEEAVDIILTYAPDRTRSHELYMLQRSIPLIHTGDSQLGIMDLQKWNDVQDILLAQGVLENPISIDEAYTTKFLDEVYSV
ncbi:MAG: ABC transporter substrate-binding protein [Nanoarchaeota archaeon]